MKMDMQSFITKIDVGGPSPNTAYIKVLWKPNENNLFEIDIFYREEHWSGRFPRDSAQEHMKRILETEDQYVKTVTDCLMKQNPKFKYEFIVNREGFAKFSWKKTFENLTAVLLHGTVDVKLDNCQDKNSLINILLDKNESLNKLLEEYKAKNEMMDYDLVKCRTDFEKLIDLKTSLETTLYGKFVQLLNSKKRRIQMLEDNLNN